MDNIMNKIDIINFIINHLSYETYLEIGIRNPNDNFNKIICKRKYGVDVKKVIGHNGVQMWKKTSDQLFSYLPIHHKFDLIFIDGDHRCEQVMKDIFNSIIHSILFYFNLLSF